MDVPPFSMTSLITSLKADANVAVVGASGGIGAAVTALLSSDPRVRRLTAFARRPLGESTTTVQHRTIDILSESSIANAADAATDADGPLDLVFVATGLLHDGDRIRPERRMSELCPTNFAEVVSANATGPALLAKHFLPRLRRNHKSVFAVLSARVGSIEDNRLGGWASYRASKAALNMLMRTFAIEHARSHPLSVVLALHPGTVATPLSAPFSSRVPTDKLFSPQQSARYLLNVIDQNDATMTGRFVAWDGRPIDF